MDSLIVLLLIVALVIVLLPAIKVVAEVVVALIVLALLIGVLASPAKDTKTPQEPTVTHVQPAPDLVAKVRMSLDRVAQRFTTSTHSSNADASADSSR